MALGTSDERDLLLPLFTGVDEHPLWDTFLHRLLARTRAQRVWLLIRPGGLTGEPPIQRMIFARGDADKPPPPIDIEALSAAGLLPYATLRPNRVYSLEETTAPDSADAVRLQRALLDASAIADARFIRIPARGDHNAWLILLHDRRDFTAGDSALLSALAPHFALALATLMELRTLRLRATIAEDALALIGVGQAMFDAQGRVVSADPIAAAELDPQTGGRPNIRAQAGQDLTAACRKLSKASDSTRLIVRLDDRDGKDMLMRRAPLGAESVLSGYYSVGLLRQPRRDNTAGAARVIAATLNLADREASLADAISRGQSIVEAGAALQLTPETARNYTKRIYAKTGVSGQADLVRLLLTGLAPFA